MSNKRRIVFRALAIALLAVAVAIPGIGKTRQLNRTDITGTWVGADDDGLYIFRVILTEAGNGNFGYSFLDDDPCVFPIDAWTYEGGKVCLVFNNALQPCVAGRAFKLETDGSRLRISVTGKDWRITAKVRREEPLLKRFQTLKAKMAGD